MAKKKKSGHAHEHGHAKLSLATDGSMLNAAFEIPAEGIFGFEHQPKSASEKKILADGLLVLREEALTLLGLPVDFACKATEINVVSSLEGVTDAAAGHADVDANYKIVCSKSLDGAILKIGVFAKFPRIKGLNVQLITGVKQQGVELTKDRAELKL